MLLDYIVTQETNNQRPGDLNLYIIYIIGATTNEQGRILDKEIQNNRDYTVIVSIIQIHLIIRLVLLDAITKTILIIMVQKVPIIEMKYQWK